MFIEEWQSAIKENENVTLVFGVIFRLKCPCCRHLQTFLGTTEIPSPECRVAITPHGWVLTEESQGDEFEPAIFLLDVGRSHLVCENCGVQSEIPQKDRDRFRREFEHKITSDWLADKVSQSPVARSLTKAPA